MSSQNCANNPYYILLRCLMLTETYPTLSKFNRKFKYNVIVIF